MLSIVIVNWNTRDLLDACLASLERFPPTESWEVIVVDNASTDGSAEMVRTRYPKVLLCAETTNTGYARGNNIGIARAQGDLILTLNPDTEFEDESLDVAIGRFRDHPRYGCLGIRLVGMDGQTQASVRGFPGFWGIFGDVTGLGRAFPNSFLDAYRRNGFDYQAEQPAPQPMGTFLLFRREALAEVGSVEHPLDEDFPIFFNEVDLLYRLHRAGWPTLYSPNAHVRHHGGAGTRQVRKSMIWESHRSLVRYLQKHHGTGLARIGLIPLAGLIYAAAFLRAKGYHAGFRA